MNNGLLPVVVSDAFLKKLVETIQKDPKTELVVDLEKQVVELGGVNQGFEINPYKKSCMINGYDDIEYLLSLNEEIRKFDKEHELVTLKS